MSLAVQTVDHILGDAELRNLLLAVVTVGHVAVILFVIVAGLTQADSANMQPFAPFGVRGIFDGATAAFFAYIGADALANTAEEVLCFSTAYYTCGRCSSICKVPELFTLEGGMIQGAE